jgi:rhodanese-related sulfurtransferase
MDQTISPNELRERLEKGEKLTVIDVREPWEYEEKNIGATLIPLGELPDRIEEIRDKQDEEVILHCKSGRRSANAQKYLQSQGFSKTRNLEGGIEAYLAQ